MKLTKGQGIIIEIMIFAVSIFLALIIFVVLSIGGDERTEEMELEADMSIKGATAISSIDSVLHMPIQNSSEVESDYNERTFYELLSLYYSTDDDPVIDGEKYSRNNVSRDLQSYLEYKAEIYWDSDEEVRAPSRRRTGGATGTGGVSHIGGSEDSSPYDVRIEHDGDLINVTQDGTSATITIVRTIPLSNEENARLEATIAR